MLNKLLLAGTMMVGSLALTTQSADAGGCRYDTPYRYSHVHRHAHVHRVPVRAHRSYYGVYRPPVYPYPASVYRAYPVYRSGYIGPRYGVGYGSYGRGGISIGIGF